MPGGDQLWRQQYDQARTAVDRRYARSDAPRLKIRLINPPSTPMTAAREAHHA
jgi:hypothetical protein